MTTPPKFDDTRLCDAMRNAGLDFSYHQHQPVFTVEESHVLIDQLPEGTSIKNLFLKDRKKNFFLVSLEDNQQVNLKALGKVIGARGGLSFASPEQLWDYMGVKPGSVTPFAILNTEMNTVQQYFDETLFQSQRFLAHPLRNDRTICIETKAAISWLASLNYPITRLDFRAAEPQIVSS